MKNLMFVLLTVVATSVSAQKPGVVASDKTGWHKIAETTADFTKDRDEIMVVGADRFAKIKFVVTDAPLHLMDLEVYYEGGDDKEDIQVRTPINAGGESRIIDLKGTERDLKKVVFVYKTVENRKDEKAHVELWGLKTNVDKKNP